MRLVQEVTRRTNLSAKSLFMFSFCLESLKTDDAL